MRVHVEKQGSWGGAAPTLLRGYLGFRIWAEPLLGFRVRAGLFMVHGSSLFRVWGLGSGLEFQFLPLVLSSRLKSVNIRGMGPLEDFAILVAVVVFDA